MVKKMPMGLMAVACCWLLSGCGGAAPAITVETTTVRTDTFSTGYATVAVAQPVTQVDVIPQYPGKVTKASVNVGESVKKGDVLFTIDSTLLKDQVKSAKAALGQANAGVAQANAGVQSASTAVTAANHALDSAKTGLKATKDGSVPATKLQYQSAVSSAQIAYDAAVKAQQLAQKATDSAKKGHDAGVVDEATLDQAQSAINQANAAVASTKLALSTAKKNFQLYNGVVSKQAVAGSQSTVNSASTGVSSAKNAVASANAAVDTAQAAVNTAQTQIDTLNDQLAYYTVKAPIAGLVIAKNVVVGGMAAQTVPAYTIADTSTMVLATAVPAAEITTLTMGGHAQVFYPDATTAQGSITAISKSANQAKLYPVQVTVGNDDDTIVSGADVPLILVDNETQSLVVPVDAVVSRGQDSYVFVADAGTAKQVAVQVTGENPYQVAIQPTGGLGDNASIVTTNADMLQDGDSIRLNN